MNLYKNDDRITDLTPYTAELKKVFPQFYDEKHPKPVRIFFEDSQRVKVTKRYGERGQSHTVKAAPGMTPVKTVCFAPNEKSTFDRIVLTPDFPVTNEKTGRLEFRKPFVHIKDGMLLVKGKDDATLVWAYFYSGRFTNGKQPNRAGRFRFEMPEKDAAQFIETERRQHQLKAEILFGGIETGLVKQIMSYFNMETTHSDEVDRKNLYDFVLASTGARETYDSMKSSYNSGEVADAMQMLREAIERGKLIEKEESGSMGWATVGKAGPGRVFAPVSEPNKLEALARICAQDKNIYARIERALEKETA